MDAGILRRSSAHKAIAGFLTDPDFQVLVDHVEALWDELEATVL